MANPSKKKGTGGENEVKALLLQVWEHAHRTEPGAKHDVYAYMEGHKYQDRIRTLWTRPDNGRWLVTMPEKDFLKLVSRVPNARRPNCLAEVKRYARFALHTIWESKFGHEADA